MQQVNRRDAMRTALAAGAMAAMSATASVAGAQDEKPDDAADDPTKRDRGFVIAAGMTEGEADCWELAAKTAGAFFDLPELHPMDKQEVATAIHVIQNKLLSRPTYRAYLERAKATR